MSCTIPSEPQQNILFEIPRYRSHYLSPKWHVWLWHDHIVCCRQLPNSSSVSHPVTLWTSVSGCIPERRKSLQVPMKASDVCKDMSYKTYFFDSHPSQSNRRSDNIGVLGRFAFHYPLVLGAALYVPRCEGRKSGMHLFGEEVVEQLESEGEGRRVCVDRAFVCNLVVVWTTLFISRGRSCRKLSLPRAPLPVTFVELERRTKELNENWLDMRRAWGALSFRPATHSIRRERRRVCSSLDRDRLATTLFIW